MRDKLYKDLTAIGCPTDFDIDIRGYSKNYFARYDPFTKKVILYPYKDKSLAELYPYEHILRHIVHEVCHHIEYSNPFFIRYKGIMHSPEFHRLNSLYQGRAKALLLFREVENEEFSYTNFKSVYGFVTTSSNFV